MSKVFHLGSRLAVLVLILLLVASQGNASPVYQISGGTLTVTGLFVGSNPPVLDIRGAVLLYMSAVNLPLSPIALYDSTGGTDPNAAVLPFGNSILYADDGTPGTVGGVSFDFANATSVGNQLFVNGFVFPIPPEATPDGALGALIAASPVLFAFQNSAFSDVGDNTFILQWGLSAVGVPEPGTFVLLASGLAIVGAARRKRIAA